MAEIDKREERDARRARMKRLKDNVRDARIAVEREKELRGHQSALRRLRGVVVHMKRTR